MTRRARAGGTAVLAGALLAAACTGSTAPDRARERPERPATADVKTRACGLPGDVRRRIRDGYVPGRSEDVLFVPQHPNFGGTFAVPNHSGPWDYLQRVPLVFYGPTRSARAGRVDAPATLADVYPTVGELTGVELPKRSGRVLDEALTGTDGAPRLVVTVVWDGVGRNVLDRWPGAWPTLARLERDGTSFVAAEVGSSPSITPSTHATLGTGALPRRHGIAGIKHRVRGDLRVALDGADPRDLRLSTFADEIDRALENRPSVGLVGWSDWHLPMMGAGTLAEGGDADDLAIILGDGDVGGNPDAFRTPSYLDDFPGFDRHADMLDRKDGRADGLWKGHDIAADHRNPAWVGYQTDMVLSLMKRAGYGRDKIPDFLFVNYKMTDYVGHYMHMTSPEMRATVRAQDDALRRLVRYLDRSVNDYVLIVTADHGHTPPAEETGGWPVWQRELKDDVNRALGAPREVVEEITAVGAFLDRAVVTDDDVARLAEFLNSYTIRDNWAGKKLPAAYRGRGDEHVFSAAFPGRLAPKLTRCDG